MRQWGAWRPWRRDSEREDVCDRDGRVTFNWLQQHPAGFDDPPCEHPSRITTGTDPWGIVDEDR
jgi:hypothetical protein